MRRMSTGWEEWVQDEKDEYRMRRMSIECERWVQNEKNEYWKKKNENNSKLVNKVSLNIIKLGL